MSLEQNKAIVHQFYEAYNQGHLERAKEIVAPNIIIYTWGATICGCNDVIEYIQMVRSTFSDSYYTIELTMLMPKKLSISNQYLKQNFSRA
jgi:predicted ester cyclase